MPAPARSPRALASEAVARLRALADPARAEGVQRYFRDTVKAFGIAAPAIRAVAAELYATVRGAWAVDEAIALCDILYTRPEIESKAVGTLILCRFKKDLPRDFPAKVRSWLAAGLLANWASVDVLCPEAMGAFLAAHPERAADVRRWAAHPNRWVKRAAAVSFIKLAKKDEFQDDLYAVSASLFPVADDLVQKANGWLLREAGKMDPHRLEAFLLRHGRAVPRTTLRYAIERFPEPRRRELLAATRGRSGPPVEPTAGLVRN
jgi:3-methyladenine DNA glycosylase AlkD